VGGACDALAEVVFDFGSEGDAELASLGAPRVELLVADPVVDGRVGDAEALGELARGDLVGRERGLGRRWEAVSATDVADGVVIEGPAAPGVQAGGVELGGELPVGLSRGLGG